MLLSVVQARDLEWLIRRQCRRLGFGADLIDGTEVLLCDVLIAAVVGDEGYDSNAFLPNSNIIDGFIRASITAE